MAWKSWLCLVQVIGKLHRRMEKKYKREFYSNKHWGDRKNRGKD